MKKFNMADSLSRGRIAFFTLCKHPQYLWNSLSAINNYILSNLTLAVLILHLFLLLDSFGGIWNSFLQYIIGIIILGNLFPLMAPRADLNSNYRRVKVPIDGHNANVILPISEEDPLNRLFFKKFGPKNMRAVKIRE